MSDPPGTKWLKGQTAKAKKRRQRDDPENMFTLEQNYARNQQWAKPGPYWTKLAPMDEPKFRAWIKQNDIDFNPDEAQPDYDMRGFWSALQRGDPRATTQVDPHDGKVHEGDYWKTPYDATFSAQSQWGIPGKTPDWKGGQLTLPTGHVIYDDDAGKWYGLPAGASTGG